MCGNQRTLSPLFLYVWQGKDLRARFSYVWQGKELGEVASGEWRVARKQRGAIYRRGDGGPWLGLFGWLAEPEEVARLEDPEGGEAAGGREIRRSRDMVAR